MRLPAKILGPASQKRLAGDYRRAARRLLLLDYDGTLVPFADHPDLARPSPHLLAILKALSDDPRTDVVLISGRDKESLRSWFREIPIHFVAEHGAWIRRKGEDWRLVRPLKNDWKGQIFPILRAAADRLPGAFVEEKEFSVVWHYRRSDPHLASLRAQELIDDLVNVTAPLGLQVLQGHKVLEIRNVGVSKGIAAAEFTSQKEYDFILAVGDDATDEELFRVLPPEAHSIRVGLTHTCARFNLAGHKEVLLLLERLIGKKKV